jgi:hypothetical protein
MQKSREKWLGSNVPDMMGVAGITPNCFRDARFIHRLGVRKHPYVGLLGALGSTVTPMRRAQQATNTYACADIEHTGTD